jgi:hypothetical protein
MSFEEKNDFEANTSNNDYLPPVNDDSSQEEDDEILGTRSKNDAEEDENDAEEEKEYPREDTEEHEDPIQEIIKQDNARPDPEPNPEPSSEKKKKATSDNDTDPLVDIIDTIINVAPEALADLVDVLDDAKADLCVAIGGGDKSRYRGKKKYKKKLKKSIKLAFAEGGISFEMSPKQSIGFYLLLLLAPSAVMAYIDRRAAKKGKEQTIAKEASTEANHKSDEAPAPGTQPTRSALSDLQQLDYSQTPEAMENRTRFAIYKSSGCYHYPNNKDYVNVDESTVKPSPMIQALFDAGFSASEIKQIVHGHTT